MKQDDMKTVSDLSKQSLLTVDYGYFMELAKACGGKDGFAHSIYGTNWRSYNPTPDKAYMGFGVPGIIHTEDVQDFESTADVIAFFDVGDGSTQRRLRREGKKVFGAGEAECIEMDRSVFKETLTAAGLPQPEYIVLYGIDALSAYLKEHNDLWVKIDSKWRGIKETWYHEDWMSSEVVVDELAHCLGFIRNSFKFVVESPWPGVETGCDLFVSGGKYLPVGTYGFEEKNEGYLCKVVNIADMPKAVKNVNDKMAACYEQWGTCGMISTEVRVLSEKLGSFDIGAGYFLDATQRAGSPPAEIISSLYTNLPYIVRACANGEMIVPAARLGANGKPVTYAAQVILKSALAACSSMPVSVDPGFEELVKFRRQCVIDNQSFIIPMNDDDIIGAAVGYGNTVEEATCMALEAADHVHCKELFYNADVFDDILETIQCGEGLGLGKF